MLYLYLLFLGVGGLTFRAEAAEEETIEKYIERGERFASQGYVDLAIKEYEKAMGAGADKAPFLNRLGWFYMQEGRFERAVAIFQRSLQAKLGQLPVYAMIARAFMAEGKMDSALSYIERARKLSPESSGVMSELGLIYLQAGLLNKARAYLDTALKLDQRNIEAHQGLGFYYTQSDSLDLALEHYHKIIEIRPDDFEAHNNVAFLYARQKNYRKALDFYQQAKKLATEPLIDAINSNIEAVRALMAGEMRARFILVKTEMEARDLLQRLEQGEDFGKLAAQFSLAPNASIGGDLGFFGPGELVGEIEETVVQLQVEEVSDVVKIPAGFIIIQRLN